MEIRPLSHKHPKFPEHMLQAPASMERTCLGMQNQQDQVVQ
jgi:hypothetical protein